MKGYGKYFKNRRRRRYGVRVRDPGGFFSARIGADRIGGGGHRYVGYLIFQGIGGKK